MIVASHQDCPYCHHHDCYAVYDDHDYCFSCGQGGQYKDATDYKRGMKQSTFDKYQVTYNKKTYTFPYGSSAYKTRSDDKKMAWNNYEQANSLFGEHLFSPVLSKTITITEGEFDAMAAYEMMGSKWPVVSIRNGASGAAKNIAQSRKYLEQFKEIVINFDNDEPGRRAAQEVAAMFEPGRCRTLFLSDAKDANDYIKMGKAEQYYKEWWAAPKYKPEGLVLWSDTWDQIENPPEYHALSVPWSGLQYHTYGLRTSEMWLISAHKKVGKTTILKEIEHHILKQDPTTKLGLIHLEESVKDTVDGLLSIELNKPIHLPDVDVPLEDKKAAFKAVGGEDGDRIIMWDHFGSNTLDALLANIRNMHAMGCKYIILDHMTILTSAQLLDERKELDQISTKLKMLCMELDIWLGVVIHLSRKGEIRGSEGPGQLANIVLSLERDKNSENAVTKHTLKVTVTDNRFCGRTGITDYLRYNPETGRLRELTPQEVLAYKEDNYVSETW